MKELKARKYNTDHELLSKELEDAYICTLRLEDKIICTLRPCHEIFLYTHKFCTNAIFESWGL